MRGITSHVTETGAIQHRYHVYGGGERIAIVTKTEEFGNITNVDEHYFLQDHLGSVRTITDGTGDVISRQRFPPYGEQLEPTDPLTDYGFTGHEHDRETGLINMRGRMYDPRIGRFLSARKSKKGHRPSVR